ncbi:MAG: hypothetical protein JSR59_15565 [Proteobacteria bacterium]|nr:hypothetical protein [Pseudomonadota bacterium]
MRVGRLGAGIAVLAALGACGGGNGQISGTISGLTSSGLVLSDDTDTLTIASGATSFSFPTLLTDGDSYDVHVTTQPAGLYCTVANGSGTVSASTPSADITVTCSASYNISGTVTNLKNSGLQISDGHETISVAAGVGTFAFPTLVQNGTAYTISIVAQPSGQTCTVTGGGSGTISGAPVTNVAIGC